MPNTTTSEEMQRPDSLSEKVRLLITWLNKNPLQKVPNGFELISGGKTLIPGINTLFHSDNVKIAVNVWGDGYAKITHILGGPDDLGKLVFVEPYPKPLPSPFDNDKISESSCYIAPPERFTEGTVTIAINSMEDTKRLSPEDQQRAGICLDRILSSLGIEAET